MRNEKAEKGWRLLQEGLLAVNYATDLFSEENKIFLDVFNGGTEEGYALDRYRYAFQDSFEEEESIFADFIDELLGKPHSFKFYNELSQMKDSGSVLIGILGFRLMKEGLAILEELKKSEPSDNWDLKNAIKDGEITNPFAEKTLHQFHLAVKGWIRAFQKELKEKLGRRDYEKKKKKADEYANSWVENKTMISE